ncbi:hypothetical protein HYT54_00805, partial [Candidatus Woesearchaeota archaeon]|nr:hypothetical protein [Candidatus Woesearchaeota archaeon]
AGEDAFRDFNTTRKLTSLILAEDRVGKAAMMTLAVRKHVRADYRRGILLINNLLKIAQDDLAKGMANLRQKMESKLADYSPEFIIIIKSENSSGAQNQADHYQLAA